MADIYKIGIRIALQSNATGVLNAMASQLLGINTKVIAAQENFNRLNSILRGGLAIAGGAAVLGTLGNIASYGTELLDQQDKMIRAGHTHLEVAQLTAKAYDSIAKSVPTATAADVLRATNQLAVVTGNFQKAMQIAPEALKIEALLGNVTGRSAEGAGHALWRSIEMKGLTAGSSASQAVGQKLLDTFVQNIAASGGKLTADDFLGMAKRGGAYWAHAAPQFLAGPMSVFAADVGGQTAGTVLATFGQFLSGATTLSKQQFEIMNRIGLIDRSKVTTDLGGRVNMKPGAIVGSLQYSGDYFDWVQKELLPHLTAAGIRPGAEQDAVLAKIGRNRNVTRMLTMFSDDGFVAQIAKDLAVFRKSLGIDQAYQDYVDNDPKGIHAAFDAQYKSMMSAIGAPLMQIEMPMMKNITDLFTQLGQLANAHPEAVKYVGEALAALSVGFIAIGSVAVIAAAVALAPGGAIAVGIIGLAASLATLGALNWKQIDAFAHSGPANIAKSIAEAIGTSLGMVPSYVAQAAIDFGVHLGSELRDAIENAAKGALSNLFHHSDYRERPNYVPPARGSHALQVHATLNVDGRKFAEAVTYHQVRAGSGPAEGAPYHDGTYSTSPVDLVLV